MSKKDDEINRQLIFNSGGANPEDYLTPKQLQRYQENPENFIDIDIDLAMNKRGSTSFDNRKKFGTEFLDNLGDRINKTAFGKFRQNQLNNQLQIQQGLFEDSSELERSLLFPEQNQIEANILEGISDATQIDERISTPLTMLAIGGAAKGLGKIKPKHLGIKQTIEPLPTKSLTRGKQLINITDQVEEVFNMPSVTVRDIIRVAKKNKISYKQAEEFLNLKLKGFEPTGTLNPGSSRETLQERFMQSPKDRFPDGGDVKNIDLGIGDTGFGYNIRKKQSVGEYRNKLFNEAGFRRNENGDFVFNLKSLLNFQKGEKRRLISQVAQTREGQTVINSFAKTKNATLLDFSETYGGYMLMTGSKPNLHHEFAAMVSAPLYDGMALSETTGSDWMRVTELLNANGIYPGSPVTDPASLGGDQSNLTQMLTKGRKGAPPEPHDILHHQFYKEMRLQDVDKGKASFWAQRAYKMNTIEGRLEVAQEYADIVNEGNRIIKSAMGQINALFGRTTDPELMVELLSEIAKTGKLKIVGTNYRLKSVESIVKIIKKEVMANLPLADEQDVINQVAKYQLSFDNEIDAIDLLHDIADFNTSMRVYGTRPPSITLKKHKKNVAAYMELIQGKLDLNTDLNAKTQAVSEFTYTRVNPQPINKQLELLFPEPKPEQLEMNLKKENPLLE